MKRTKFIEIVLSYMKVLFSYIKINISHNYYILHIEASEKYSVEEWKEYFNGKRYIGIEELINVNLMQFLMQRQDKVIKNEGEIDKIEEYGIV